MGQTKDELSRHILRGHFQTPSHVSREPETLLRAMMLVDPNRREPIERLRMHAWLQRASPTEPEINTEHVRVGEIDGEVVGELQALGVSGEQARESVRQGRHDHVNATYQLLLKRKQHPLAATMEAVEQESQRAANEAEPPTVLGGL